MTNAIRSLWLGLGLAMAGSGVAAAGDGSGAGSGAGAPTTTSEIAGTDESLQNGGDTRPWAAVVKKSEQEAARKLFHDGNVQLNDGLFAKAAEVYKQALTHWDHPAIHYNLALALMNLDQPIESQANFRVAVEVGGAPRRAGGGGDRAKGDI